MAIALVALLLASSLLAFSLTSPSPSASHSTTALGSTGTPASQTPAVVTHGDLVVTSGETYVIQPSFGNSTYYQGGNITVLAGGTLDINRTTLTFVQFVAPTGTAAARLSHVYHFLDQGTVNVRTSTITTDLLLVDAYPKLPITISGTMNLWNSTLEFPGWVSVTGIDASLTLNGSTIEGNPAITGLHERVAIQGDTAFAPDLTVSGGASLNLFGSNYTGVYANNLTSNGTPRPSPLFAPHIAILNTSRANVTNLSTPNDTQNLTQDWLYPSGITGGEIVVYYNNSFTSPSTSVVTAYYDGLTFPLGPITFKADELAATATLGFSAGLTNEINLLGLLQYLNLTGVFGGGPLKIAVAFATATGPSVVNSTVLFDLNPPLSYNLNVTGSHSKLSTVDTSLGLTFGETPSSPLSILSPYPWYSNKVALTSGATAYLANLAVPSPLPGVYTSSGAIVADNNSHAYLYRWAVFNLTGAGGILPLSGGKVTTTYAYPSNQTNNATTAALNDIQTNNTAIADYLAYWDGLHHIATYGTSGRGGDVSLLLASNEVTGSAPADGFYLGDYHVVVTVPTTVNNSSAFNWSVSAYPSGVALATPGYATADFGPSLNFPSYFAGLHVFAVVTFANGTANTTVREGQLLTANITLIDTGAAPILSVNATLFYNASSVTALDTVNHTVDLTALGQKYTFNVSWLITDNVTGRQGATFLNNFSVLVIWNDLLPQQGGGSLTDVIGVKIAPSQIKVTFTPPGSSTLIAGHTYTTPIQVEFNGTYTATVILTATNGANSIVLAEAQIPHGTGALYWTASDLTPGTAYTLTVTATYNGKTAMANATGTFALPSPPPPSATSFLTHKYLGVPLWIWIAIVAAILVGGFLFMRLARRTAAGKLVECGECGALIPENAAACPKCGAEFESDLVRCSRCASTIPANSKSCPECSAQLLGKPGEGMDDPERAGYEDFINRYRADGKKELGENYTEGAFWDWWKRQATYTPFSQWKLQQGQGTARAGMTAPPAGPASAEPAPRPALRSRAAPPSGGAAPSRPPTPPPAAKGTSAPTTPAAPAPAGGLKPCPTCGKEIPPEYLVCPFCGSVTQ